MFVWLHLSLSLYPLPSQRAGDIETFAIDAAENSTSLIKQGAEPNHHMTMSKEEWEEELTKSYWVDWIIIFSLLLFGLTSTYFLYRNLKIWPICLGGTTIICLVYSLRFYLNVDSPFVEWIEVMEFYLKNSHYSLAYFGLMWPLYLVTLFLFSFFRILSIKKNSFK